MMDLILVHIRVDLRKCFENKLPDNGYYLFDEVSRGTWVITSAIKVVKVLTDTEIDEILDQQNYDKVNAYANYKIGFEKRKGIVV